MWRLRRWIRWRRKLGRRRRWARASTFGKFPSRSWRTMMLGRVAPLLHRAQHSRPRRAFRWTTNTANCPIVGALMSAKRCSRAATSLTAHQSTRRIALAAPQKLVRLYVALNWGDVVAFLSMPAAAPLTFLISAGLAPSPGRAKRPIPRRQAHALTNFFFVLPKFYITR